VLTAALIPCPARGDQFVLETGGRIEGDLLNPDQQPRETFVVRTAAGGQVTLQAGQVRQWVPQSPEQKRYEALLPRMPQTAEGNWTMAQWCQKQGLMEQADFHMQEVLRLDPDHEPARRALGFGRVGDQWVQPDQWMRDRGFVRHQGAWRLPQEVRLETARREQELAEKQWKQNLKMWRGWLDGRRSAEGAAEIRQVRDPLAAAALAELLSAESVVSVRQLYVEALGRLESELAVAALIRGALEDGHAEVRMACVEELQARHAAAAVPVLIQALSSTDNVRMNRAAVALAHLGDASAILPLVEVLTTKHRAVVSGGSGQMGATFARGSDGNPGMSGFSFGGGQKVQEQTVANRAVLDALISLTGGANFQYDREQWRRWYAGQQQPAQFSLRRDE